MKSSSVVVCLAGASAVSAAAVPREQNAVPQQQTAVLQEQTTSTPAREDPLFQTVWEREEPNRAARESSTANAGQLDAVNEAPVKDEDQVRATQQQEASTNDAPTSNNDTVDAAAVVDEAPVNENAPKKKCPRDVNTIPCAPSWCRIW
jgi:hypothetical protein